MTRGRKSIYISKEKLEKQYKALGCISACAGVNGVGKTTIQNLIKRYHIKIKKRGENIYGLF